MQGKSNPAIADGSTVPSKPSAAMFAVVTTSNGSERDGIQFNIIELVIDVDGFDQLRYLGLAEFQTLFCSQRNDAVNTCFWTGNKLLIQLNLLLLWHGVGELIEALAVDYLY